LLQKLAGIATRTGDETRGMVHDLSCARRSTSSIPWMNSHPDSLD
jgi:hypothetical protein